MKKVDGRTIEGRLLRALREAGMGYLHLIVSEKRRRRYLKAFENLKKWGLVEYKIVWDNPPFMTIWANLLENDC